MPGNLNNIPPSVIASWPTPNYVDPVQRTWMPIYAGTLQGVTSVMVLTRLGLRFRQQAGSMGLDDALLIPGFVFGSAFSALSIVTAVHYGSDRHIWDVPVDELSTNVLIAWLNELLFVLSTCCTKISVLLFYRRLVQESISKKWKIATIVAIIFTVVYGLVLVFFLIFTCDPTDAYWKVFSPNYTEKYSCLDTKPINPLSGALSVFSDFYSVILPMGMLHNFDLNRRKKIALNVVFSLGLLVVLTGIVRTYYFTQLGMAYDLSWIGFDVIIWSELECQLALICASAPAFRVFFRQYLGQPINRAMRSRQSHHDTIQSYSNSGRRSSIPAGPLSSHPQDRKASIASSIVSDDKNFLVIPGKPSLMTVEERDFETSPVSSASSETSRFAHAIDPTVQSYAMQHLGNKRPR